MLKCQDCPIYNRSEKICGATVIFEGEYFELKTEPDDDCFWQTYKVPVQEISLDSSDKCTSYDPN